METGTFKRSASYAILLLLAVGARAQFTSYPQPSSTAELPQDSVTQYSGNFCYCDLTAHACDSNCCCDTACTPEDQLLFTSCTQETSTAPELNYCIDEALVATVNLPESGTFGVVKKQPSGDSLGKSLFCIVEENNPFFGSLFEDPVPASDAVLQESLQNYPEVPATAPPALPNLSTGYRIGQRIPVGYQYEASITQNAVFSLPVDPLSGFCTLGGLPVGFGVDAPHASTDSAHRCIRNVAPSECIPGGALSASSYISNLHFSSTPGSAPAITPALQTTRFVGGSTVTLAEDGNLPEPLFDTARGMCANVPQHIAYSVLTLDGGGIAEVRADVTVANVSVATTGSLVVQQAFSVTFRSLSSAADARPNSGAPGYRPGSMILFGTALADASTIDRRSSGMPLPAAAPLTGSCTLPDDSSPPVRFAVDTVATCAVHLTPAQLRSFCRNGLSSLPASIAGSGGSVLIDRFLNLPESSRVGIWGSSSTNTLADWVPVAQEVPDADMLWDEAEATCSHVAAGVQLDVLVASIGNVRDPQRRVQYVRSKIVYSTWRHPLAGHMRDNSTDAAFAFPVEMRVRFVAQVQQEQDVMKHLPPLRSSLPEDFFYPFLSSGSDSKAASSILSVMIVLSVILGLF